jgi:hypothetical protein
MRDFLGDQHPIHTGIGSEVGVFVRLRGILVLPLMVIRDYSGPSPIRIVVVKLVAIFSMACSADCMTGRQAREPETGDSCDTLI